MTDVWHFAEVAHRQRIMWQHSRPLSRTWLRRRSRWRAQCEQALSAAERALQSLKVSRRSNAAASLAHQRATKSSKAMVR